MYHEPSEGQSWEVRVSLLARPHHEYSRQPEVTQFDMTIWIKQKVLKQLRKHSAGLRYAHVRFDIAMYESLFMTLLDCKDHLSRELAVRSNSKKGRRPNLCDVESCEIFLKHILFDKKIE
jgi:hypothetical protein